MVERHQGRGHVHGKHAGSGMGVDQDVVFGVWAHVARPLAAAHDVEVRDPPRQVGPGDQQHGDVGQRADRGDRQRLRGTLQKADERADGMFGPLRVGLGRQPGSVQAAGALDLLLAQQRSQHRAGAAPVDRNLGPPGSLDNAPGVRGRVGDRNIALDRRERHHRERLRAGEGKEDGKGIVLAGVAVEDHLNRLHRDSA